jgi:hypothetical protein
MLDHWQQEGSREVVGPAEHDRRPVFGQLRQRMVRVRRLWMIDHDKANVLAGYGPDGFTVTAEEQLALTDREVRGLLGDFEGTFNHSEVQLTE